MLNHSNSNMTDGSSAIACAIENLFTYPGRSESLVSLTPERQIDQQIVLFSRCATNGKIYIYVNRNGKQIDIGRYPIATVLNVVKYLSHSNGSMVNVERANTTATGVMAIASAIKSLSEGKTYTELFKTEYLSHKKVQKHDYRISSIFLCGKPVYRWCGIDDDPYESGASSVVSSESINAMNPIYVAAAVAATLYRVTRLNVTATGNPVN